MTTYEDVPHSEIEKLIALFSQNEEFTLFIAEEAINPFRTTSYMKKVSILDNIFRNQLKDTPIKLIQLQDFVIDGDESILHQLPNLLKTYVIQTDYEFGENNTVDDNFCYIIYRIIQTERVYKSFKTFENAFLKASTLRYNYKLFTKKMEELFDYEVDENGENNPEDFS